MEDTKEEETTIRSLTEDQATEICETFALYETHTPGMISQNDLGDVMYQLGIIRTESEINCMFQEFEYELNEGVTVAQFLHVMTKVYQQLYDKDSLKAAFQAIDETKNDLIHGSDLRHFALSMGMKFTDLEFEEMFKQVDFDGDGKIGWTDFVKAVTKP